MVARPVTGANACMSTSLPTVLPSSRAVILAAFALAMFIAPEAASHRSAAHSRKCTVPPRGYTPGAIRPRIARAPSAPIGMRPNGVHSTANATASQVQDNSVSPSTFATIATHVTAADAFSVITGTMSSVCASRVAPETGVTERLRVEVWVVRVRSSISDASVSNLGWS